MLVKNTFTHDTRVIKEARSLIAAGNEVEVIASRGEGLPDYEIREDKIIVQRVGKMKQYVRLYGQTLISGHSRKLNNLASIFLRAGNWLPSGIGLFFYKARILRWLVSIATLPFVFFVVLLNASLKILRALPWNMAAWIKNGLLYSHNDDEFVKAGIRSGADVFHAHDLNTLFPAVVLARKTGASLVYDSHELYVNRRAMRGPWHRLRWLLIEAQMIRHAEEVITVSDSIAQVLVERYKIEKPTLVRNVQGYVGTTRKGVLRELPALQHIGPQDSIAIYAGRITGGRGLGILVEASQYLDGVYIVLLGRENIRYSRELKAMIRQRGVEHKVILVPPVEPEEVHEYVSSADVGLMLTENVCLSYYYGAGNKLFHYLMAGVPVIVSDQPEKRKIVETYDVGRFCKVEDPRELARVIQELADDTDACRRYAANARKAARILNWENEEKKLLDVYERIANKRKKIGR
jgi:glycosyltransferase involved in cell wall biosynthesis